MSDSPEMLVWDEQNSTWRKIAFSPEFGTRNVRQTAEYLRSNGVPACAVTPRMRGAK